MRAGSLGLLVLLAIAGGCTLLTDIPDDVSAGSRAADAGSADARDAGSLVKQIDDAGAVDADHVNEDEGGGPSVVAIDAVGPSSDGAGGDGRSSPLVWSHTTSGTNRALFVTVTISADPDTSVTITGVTFEQTPLAQLAIQHANDQNGGYTTLWVVANPVVGAHAVSVAFMGNPEAITAGSISFTGVDQVTPYQNLAKASGDGAKARLSVGSAPGNMVVGALVAACNVQRNEQTRWVRNVTCGGGGGNGAQSAVPGAASVGLLFNLDSDWWGVIGADVRAASP